MVLGKSYYLCGVTYIKLSSSSTTANFILPERICTYERSRGREADEIAAMLKQP